MALSPDICEKGCVRGVRGGDTSSFDQAAADMTDGIQQRTALKKLKCTSRWAAGKRLRIHDWKNE